VFFKLFVNDAIFDSIFLAGVCSIIRKNALPTIMASTPYDKSFLASLGVLTQKPIPIGIFLFTILFVFLIASMVYF